MIGEEKFTILIVDDERSNITALTKILRPSNVVLAAKDGVSAIEVAKNSQPDLILLDILMPDMSGYDVLKELKKSDITRNIPVIFITGLDSRQDEEKGLILGAVDYITKPFHDSITKLRVETHLKLISQMRTIERLGMIDALTNIPNRRYYNHQLNVEWNRAVRDKALLSILMIDIDKFKNFNDRYGHSHGDKAIKTIAEVISKALKRPADFAARWGGEEFTVLLPDIDLNGALEVAERIRVNIENTVIAFSDERYSDYKETKITVSIGVWSQFPTADSIINDFVCMADKALYLAKEAGRNTVKSFMG